MTRLMKVCARGWHDQTTVKTFITENHLEGFQALIVFRQLRTAVKLLPGFATKNTTKINRKKNNKI